MGAPPHLQPQLPPCPFMQLLEPATCSTLLSSSACASLLGNGGLPPVLEETLPLSGCTCHSAPELPGP